jgi:hypothetical protein
MGDSMTANDRVKKLAALATGIGIGPFSLRLLVAIGFPATGQTHDSLLHIFERAPSMFDVVEHFRRDAKNCRLLEQTEAFLDPRVPRCPSLLPAFIGFRTHPALASTEIACRPLHWTASVIAASYAETHLRALAIRANNRQHRVPPFCARFPVGAGRCLIAALHRAPTFRAATRSPKTSRVAPDPNAGVRNLHA